VCVVVVMVVDNDHCDGDDDNNNNTACRNVLANSILFLPLWPLSILKYA